MFRFLHTPKTPFTLRNLYLYLYLCLRSCLCICLCVCLFLCFPFSLPTSAVSATLSTRSTPTAPSTLSTRSAPFAPFTASTFLASFTPFTPAPLKAYAGVPSEDANTKNANNRDRETIRVGFFSFDGYHIVNEDGTRSGYGYDFLRMASRYLNVDYEYIGYDKSWDDMLTMLQNGEIDLVTSAQKVSNREEFFDFSKPIGTSSAILTVRSDNNQIIEQDYSTYEGMRIGMLLNNTRNDDLKTFADEHHFSYESVYFSSSRELADALQRGEIDAIISSSLRRTENKRVIEDFAISDFYAIVNKGNTHLLDEINYAIDQMNAAEGDWTNNLKYKYYNHTGDRNLDFSDREKELIHQYASGEKTLTVTCNVDRDPYSYMENGELRGIIPDIFAMIMDKAGIPYTVKIPKSRKEYEELQKSEAVDLFMDARFPSETYVEDNHLALTAPYINMTMAMVTRRDFDGTIKKIAVADHQGLSKIEDGLNNSSLNYGSFHNSNHDQEVEEIQTSSRSEALNMVLDGKADATFVYLYTAQKFVNQDERGLLTYTALESPVYPHYICLSSTVDHELSGILTKCIYALPNSEIESLISKYTRYKAENITPFTLIRLHPGISVFALIFLVWILLTLIFLQMKLHTRQKMLAFEQKKAIEMNHLARQAQEANHSKSRFLSNMSHDIRTPLNAIIGFANLAKCIAYNPEKTQDYLSKILISSNHLLAIVNDILEMSRIESGKLQLTEAPCCLTDIVDEVAVIINEQTHERNQTFTIDVSSLKNPYILCDKLRMKEILVNLLGNSVKFTPNGGTIALTIIEKTDTSSSDTQNQESVDKFVDKFGLYEIHVKDNGCGMSPEFMKKIFEPFEREQNSTVSGIQGTGLGLPITKRYIDMMNGKIEILSEEHKGTEIIITLRNKLTKPIEHSEDSTSSPMLSQNEFAGSRILLVEDNELNREIASTILIENGFRVDVAENGAIAVEKVKSSEAGFYNIILMDIQMPVMNGYEATRNIRALDDPALSNIPIIAVSANAYEEDKSASLSAGMNGHIAKPIDMNELFQTIHLILKERNSTEIK